MNLAIAKRASSALTMAALLGAVGAVLVIIAFTTRRIIGFSAMGGLVVAAGAYFSGNVRLYCLWGLILTAPIDLSKKFIPLLHMGGEAAFRIEASDLFLGPLLAFLAFDVARERGWNLRVPRAALYWTISIFLGAIVVGLGPFRLAAAHECVRMTKVLLLFLLIANAIVRERQIKHIVAGLFVVVIVQSIIALIQYFFKVNLGLEVLGETGADATEGLSKGTLMGKEITRVGALMIHPNVFAAYLAFLLPMGIALLFTRISTPLKALCATAVVLGEVALVATGSRSGWITFAVGFLLVLLLSFANAEMRKRYVALRVIILIAAVGVGLGFSGYILDRLTLSDPGAVSLRWRIAGDAWRMIQAKPLFGHGLNSYVYAMPPYTMFSDYAGVVRAYGDYLPAVHNIYLLWFAEQGIVGIALHLLMMGSILWMGISNLKVANEFLFAVNIGAICGVVAIMADGMVSFSLRINGMLRVFWIVAGLIAAIRYMQARSVESARAAAEEQPAAD